MNYTRCAGLSRESMPANISNFMTHGFCIFAADAMLHEWVHASLSAARATVSDPENSSWMRYRKTWFVGVNALPNDTTGAVANGPPLRGAAVDFVRNELGLRRFSWDRAQVSICYPGYPLPAEDEGKSLYNYRVRRDAAHIDGLRREGPNRRRFLREHHGFILGIPMVHFGAGAAPFVVWRGSHNLVRAAFEERLQGIPSVDWPNEDLTDAYQTARQRVFAACERVEVHTQPGEAFLVHRLALHGMAPWAEGAAAGRDGRMVVYFRPEIGGPQAWMNAP